MSIAESDPLNVPPVTIVGEEEEELGAAIELPFTYLSGGEVMNQIATEMPISELRKMRKTDGQVRALMRLLTLPIKASLRQAHILPSGASREQHEHDEGGEEEAQFIKDMLFLPRADGGMTTSFERIMSQMLLALVEGFSPFEIVNWIPDRGELKGKVTLKKLARRPPETIMMKADSRGGFAGMVQRMMIDGEYQTVDIPLHRSFYWAANEEENPFYGVSYFMPAFYHYDKKIKLYYLMHLAAQHRAVPGRMGKLPPGPTSAQKRQFRKALQDYGVGSSMMIPDGYDVEEFGKGLSTFDFEGAINHHNSQMSKSVLSQFLDSNESAAMIDFGKENHDPFTMMLTAIMEDVATGMNQFLFPRYIDWNFGSNSYPTFQFEPMTEDQRRAIKEVFEELSTATTSNATPEFMFELEQKMADRLGLEINYQQIEDDFEKRKQVEMDLLDNPIELQVAEVQASAFKAQQDSGNSGGDTSPKSKPPGAQPPGRKP